MWITNISKIMYNKCKENDKKEYRDLISEDKFIYWYCLYIKDRKEMWSKLVDSEWIFWYSKMVKDRPKLVDKLTDEYYNKYMKEKRK